MRTQQRYDHRLRRLIQTTGDLKLAVRHGVPRSTARGWLKQTRADVVTVDVLDSETSRLQQEVLSLRRRVTRLLRLLHLIVVALKVAGFSLDRLRIPEGRAKQRLLRAIERSRADSVPVESDRLRAGRIPVFSAARTRAKSAGMS